MGSVSEINRLIYLCTRKQTFQAFASICLVAVSDRRRDAGARTKQRLLDATLALLAERGEEGVTLRDITTAADANVASVSYHFGSLGALCCATAKQAVTRLLDEQVARLLALDDDAGVEAIAGAIATPIVAALSDPEHPDRALLRIFDRTLSGPPGELREWLEASLARVDAELMARLARALPDVGEDELRFRWNCVAGILRALPVRTGVEGRCAADLERMLLPVLAGALAGRA
jgi:AcrR family transcriptional regulator